LSDRGIATLALALAGDALFGEPAAAWHPVVAMGKSIDWAERFAPHGRPTAQLLYGGMVVGGGLLAWAGGALLVARLAARLPPALAALAGAAMLKPMLAVRALDEAARAVASALHADDLCTARTRLRALVSRETQTLDRGLVTAAAVESVAENLGDSFVAPLFWYAALGLPGAVAYRYVNTCDAMLGYRGRYEYLGKASARLDDAASWLPARLAAFLLVVAARLAGGDAASAWRVLRRDHGRTASPNAGWPMSAMAGALAVRLEKRDHYTLGDGSPPDCPDTILRAVRLARVSATLALLAYVLGSLARRAHATAR